MNKFHWEQVLVFDRLSGKLENHSRLRSAMIKSGIAKCCTNCKVNYNLHIHHIDDNHLNNLKFNLEFLCTKCHPKPPRKRKPESIHKKIMKKMTKLAVKEIQEIEDARVFAELDMIANSI